MTKNMGRDGNRDTDILPGARIRVNNNAWSNIIKMMSLSGFVTSLTLGNALWIRELT